jgi:hypothetical protein
MAIGDMNAKLDDGEYNVNIYTDYTYDADMDGHAQIQQVGLSESDGHKHKQRLANTTRGW